MGAGPPKLLCPACVNARLQDRGRAVHNLNRACNALRVRVRALTTSAAARQGVRENGADLLEAQRRQRRIEALRRRAGFLRKEIAAERGETRRLRAHVSSPRSEGGGTGESGETGKLGIGTAGFGSTGQAGGESKRVDKGGEHISARLVALKEQRDQLRAQIKLLDPPVLYGLRSNLAAIDARIQAQRRKLVADLQRIFPVRVPGARGGRMVISSSTRSSLCDIPVPTVARGAEGYELVPGERRNALLGMLFRFLRLLCVYLDPEVVAALPYELMEETRGECFFCLRRRAVEVGSGGGSGSPSSSSSPSSAAGGGNRAVPGRGGDTERNGPGLLALSRSRRRRRTRLLQRVRRRLAVGRVSDAAAMLESPERMLRPGGVVGSNGAEGEYGLQGRGHPVGGVGGGSRGDDGYGRGRGHSEGGGMPGRAVNNKSTRPRRRAATATGGGGGGGGGEEEEVLEEPPDLIVFPAGPDPDGRVTSARDFKAALDALNSCIAHIAALQGVPRARLWRHAPLANLARLLGAPGLAGPASVAEVAEPARLSSSPSSSSQSHKARRLQLQERMRQQQQQQQQQQHGRPRRLLHKTSVGSGTGAAQQRDLLQRRVVHAQALKRKARLGQRGGSRQRGTRATTLPPSTRGNEGDEEEEEEEEEGDDAWNLVDKDVAAEASSPSSSASSSSPSSAISARMPFSIW